MMNPSFSNGNRHISVIHLDGLVWVGGGRVAEYLPAAQLFVASRSILRQNKSLFWNKKKFKHSVLFLLRSSFWVQKSKTREFRQKATNFELNALSINNTKFKEVKKWLSVFSFSASFWPFRSWTRTQHPSRAPEDSTTCPTSRCSSPRRSKPFPSRLENTVRKKCICINTIDGLLACIHLDCKYKSVLLARGAMV